MGKTQMDLVSGDIIKIGNERIIVQYTDSAGLWDIWGNLYVISETTVIEWVGNLFDA